MKLVFVTNYVHHHQLPVADEFYSRLGDDYIYVTTKPLPDWLIKGGYDPNLDRKYIIRSYSSEKELEGARQLIDESDVVIAGVCPDEWLVKRKKEGKIVFYYSERIYKKKFSWLKLPFHVFTNYYKYGRFKNTYMLCASAYTSHDYGLTHCFTGKCFKWGYMTAVNNDIDIDFNTLNSNATVQIMWCARFLDWKHPELPVKLAYRLKQKGYNFHIDMFGGGEEMDNVCSLIKKYKVENYVTLRGNMPNPRILEEMQLHSIFLFTSDKNEGWGAVLNESMANGCVPVASNEIGSVPYLIKDRQNGMVFKSCNLNSLEHAVCILLDQPELIRKMRRQAIQTMKEIWSPKIAVDNFLTMAKYALSGTLVDYKLKEGPASWD